MNTKDMDVSLNIFYKKYHEYEDPEVAEISVFGDGEEEHFLTAFRTILVAVGFTVDRANELEFSNENNAQRPLGCGQQRHETGKASTIPSPL